MAAKKTASKKSTAKKSSRVTQSKMRKVMHEFKHGELKSGGRAKVKNPKQAIAIGLSEARKAGAKVPAKKGARKAAATKTSSKGATKKR
jgi:Family of unknown function (DUF6496)